MIRRFDGERPAFLLDTDHSSYAFRVLPTGHLEHLYYGRRIGAASAEALEALTEKRSFQPGAVIAYDEQYPTVTLEDLCLEMCHPGGPMPGNVLLRQGGYPGALPGAGAL